MDLALKNALKETRESLLETYGVALEFGDSSDDYAKTLKSLLEESLNIEETGKSCELALQKANIQSNLDDFDQVYDTELKSPSGDGAAYQPKMSKEYKDFEEEFKRKETIFKARKIKPQSSQPGPSQCQAEQVICDDIVIKVEVSTVDPLTKKPMQNPVKNKICGHHYEESTIKEAISINRRVRCPVACCGNKKVLVMQDLVDDEEFKEFMASQIDDDEE